VRTNEQCLDLNSALLYSERRVDKHTFVSNTITVNFKVIKLTNHGCVVLLLNIGQ